MTSSIHVVNISQVERIALSRKGSSTIGFVYFDKRSVSLAVVIVSMSLTFFLGADQFGICVQVPSTCGCSTPALVTNFTTPCNFGECYFFLSSGNF